MASDEIGMEDRERYSTIINAEALRLTRLLDDLLDLTVLESGQVNLNVSEVNLNGIIDRALDASVTPEASPAIVVYRDKISENVEVRTDGDRLTQVIINLITNAQKYCDAPQPELRIDVKHDKDHVQIDLVDNGSGISREHQSMIFEKFSRLTDNAKAGGAGLGLAICREIMLNLGGSIAYLPGQGGAAFRIRLPKHHSPVGR